jgi:hypothetical protein
MRNPTVWGSNPDDIWCLGSGGAWQRHPNWVGWGVGCCGVGWMEGGWGSLTMFDGGGGDPTTKNTRTNDKKLYLNLELVMTF